MFSLLRKCANYSSIHFLQSDSHYKFFSPPVNGASISCDFHFKTCSHVILTFGITERKSGLNLTLLGYYSKNLTFNIIHHSLCDTKNMTQKASCAVINVCSSSHYNVFILRWFFLPTVHINLNRLSRQADADVSVFVMMGGITVTLLEDIVTQSLFYFIFFERYKQYRWQIKCLLLSHPLCMPTVQVANPSTGGCFS